MSDENPAKGVNCLLSQKQQYLLQLLVSSNAKIPQAELGETN